MTTLSFEATTAYLGPLLKKHTAGEAIVWEDLLSSHDACSNILRQSNNPPFFLVDQMKKLHESQVKAYRESAIRSIKNWALSLPFQPMNEGDTKNAFVERCCVSAGRIAVPNWQLPNTTTIAINEIRKRAMIAYEKYNPIENSNEKSVDEIEDDEESSEVDDNDEDGEIEVTPAVTNTALSTETKQQPFKSNNYQNRKKGRGGNNNKKNAPAKGKGTSAKGGYRNKGGPTNKNTNRRNK